MRSELALVEGGFDLLPTLSGNGGKHVTVNSGGTALAASAVVSESGSTLTVAGNLTVTGNTTLGDASGDTLTVAPSAVTWSGNPTHSGNHTFSGNVTLSAGTANRLLYLDGSKLVTTNAGLTYDGTYLGATFRDNGFTLKDNTDATKTAVFELSGITTGQTRTYTLPDVSDSLATLGNVSQTFAGTVTVSGTFNTTGTFSTIGNTTAATTIGLGPGATVSGSTKTINIGTAGVSGSTTNINIGSAVAGSTTSIIFNSGGAEAGRFSGGNLGVGTSSPAQLIDAVRTHNAGTSITVRNANTEASANAQFIANADTTVGRFSVYSSGAGALANLVAIEQSTNNPIVFYLNSTERVRIDGSGNVGVNTNNPGGYGGRLNVYAGDIVVADVGTASGASAPRLGSSSQALVFKTNSGGGSASEVARIDGSGNLGIGTSSPTRKLQVSSAGSNYIASVNISGSTSALLLGAESGVTALYSWTTVGGSTGVPMTFYAGASEGMRLDTNSYLLVGYTTSNGAYRLQVNSQIYATNATIATSDGRYKEDVQPVENALDTVAKLRPVSFKWKQHEVHNFPVGQTDVGFIAQEVQTALDGSAYADQIVKANTCTLPSGEEETFLGLADSKLIPVLVKAIQEQQSLIEELRARVAALEAQ
jgi:hypothetical protein